VRRHRHRAGSGSPARATPAEQVAITAGLTRMVAAEAANDDLLDTDIAFHFAVLEASKADLDRQTLSAIDRSDP
jgi:DNA-binding FadR family transcriptional regulator